MQIEPDQREVRLAEFVVKELGDYWGVPDKQVLAETLKILRGEVLPIGVTTTKGTNQ